MKKLLIFCLFCLSMNVLAARIKVSVKGMTCQMCVKAIKHEFSKIDKTSSVEVDVEKGQAIIEEKEKVSLTDDEIKKAIKLAGYEVTDINRK